MRQILTIVSHLLVFEALASMGTTRLRAFAILDTPVICAKHKSMNVTQIHVNLVDAVRILLTVTFVVAHLERLDAIVK